MLVRPEASRKTSIAMMSLVADYGGTSAESETEHSEEVSEEESETAEEDREEKRESARRLPTPDFENAASKDSVFVNPFAREENAKKAILEKHVKMVPTKDKVQTINGRKICWNYRKGRCRFGHTCTFAHDTDLQSNGDKDSVDIRQNHVNEEGSNDRNVSVGGGCSEGASSKKKRPGLGDDIIPGKKVLRAYKRQKCNK